jgi:hypothetical protein
MIEVLIEEIAKAASKIDQDYFRLTTARELKVRERVFCYELYHQIRVLGCEKKLGLTVNGEVDKSGHVDFAPADRKNPDFVFHIPGSHIGNTIICEVKGSMNKTYIEKDFNTISLFITKYHYQAGVFILYNHSMDNLKAYLYSTLLPYVQAECANRIFIICVSEAGKVDPVKSLSDL